MFQSTVSRVRFALSALGFVVLSASLFNWTQALPTARQQYTWVDAGTSDASALDTAEIWQVSGSCARPYFIRAALRSKAKLKAYYDLAPEPVRARLNRSSGIPRSAAPKGWYRLVKDQPDNPSAGNGDPDMEYSALLHVQYAEWYANVFKLEIEATRWQQRLTEVSDQRLTLSESARNSFGASSVPNAGALGITAGFDTQVLATLGLSGFPKDEEQSLKTDCVNVSLVKKILTSPSYLGELLALAGRADRSVRTRIGAYPPRHIPGAADALDRNGRRTARRAACPRSDKPHVGDGQKLRLEETRPASSGTIAGHTRIDAGYPGRAWRKIEAGRGRPDRALPALGRSAGHRAGRDDVEAMRSPTSPPRRFPEYRPRS